MALLGIWSFLGSWISPFAVRLIRGRLGSVIRITPFFDISGDWFLETSKVVETDLSTITSTLGELFQKRWRDTILTPVAVSGLIVGLLYSLIQYISLEIYIEAVVEGAPLSTELERSGKILDRSLFGLTGLDLIARRAEGGGLLCPQLSAPVQ